MKKSLVLGLFMVAVLALPGLAEESAALRQDTGFSIDFAVANVGIDGFETNRLALGVNPRWCWNVRWCWWIDIWWIPEPWPDPWRGILVVDDIPVPVGDLEVGPGLMLGPALEYNFQTENRLRPSVYFGAGVQLDGGETTRIAGVGDFTTESTTSPMVLYGVALTYDLNDRSALRVSGGASTMFADEMDITGPNGELFTVDGDSVTSGIVLLGVNVRFGGRG